MDIVNALLAAGVDVNSQLNMRRPGRADGRERYSGYFENTGCTPLMRAALSDDVEMARVLLDKGASPDIGGMGLTPFLIAAGLGAGGGDLITAPTARSGAENRALMDLLLQHGADVNARVTGANSYSFRIVRYPPIRPEGMSALHVAAQRGRTDVVRYLLEKGANPELVDAEGHKPIDLVGTGGRGEGAPPAAGAAARGGPEAVAELRALLQNAASNR